MHCRRGMVDDPMNIRGLKRYAVDHAGDYRPVIKPATGKRVAVIGGGPAGISCAYYLTLMGHKVKIFEQRAHLGGMLRYGIPNYRLPREQLDSEIQWILDCGIDVELNHSVDGDEMTRLRSEYDAVYLAIGAHADKKLGLPGEDAEGVMSAVQLLRDMGDNNPPDFKGLTVAVVGGGNVAMDVARTSVRLGAEKVIIAYRRRVADMTAQDEEIAGAEGRGLRGHGPARAQGGRRRRERPRGRPQGRAADHRRPQARPSRAARGRGRRRRGAVRPRDRGNWPGHRLRYLRGAGRACKWGRIVTDPDGAVPGQDGLFSGGDCQSGPATVIRAINAGKVAAGNIDNYLGFNHKIELDVELPPVQFKGKISCARCEMREREASERINDFDIVENGLTDQEAHQEASRCLRCDHFGFGAFRGGRIEQW